MKRILLMAGLMTMLGSVNTFAEEIDTVNNKANQYVCNDVLKGAQVGVWSYNSSEGWKEVFNSVSNNTQCTTNAEQTTNAVTLPTFEFTTEATTNAVTKPTVEQTTEATTNAVTKPTVEQTTEATTNAVTKPTVEQTTQATTEKVTATTEATTESTTVNSNSTYANQVLELVNQERAKNGLSSLKLSSSAQSVAQIKAQDMAENNYFSHTSPTYGTPFEMLKQFGVSYKTAGENIAKGQSSPQAVMNAWMNSSGHKANILNSGYTELGVGYTVKNGTTYWVQMFIG